MENKEIIVRLLSQIESNKWDIDELRLKGKELQRELVREIMACREPEFLLVPNISAIKYQLRND